ncbi:MAG TPA: polymer-forming cytoskeletal protein [Solirubrobacterales bacterium]|nr:polymer-forming cytoskeletal protein [Solirubrobacterales bacterium]
MRLRSVPIAALFALLLLAPAAGAAPIRDDDAVVVINGDVNVGIDEEVQGIYIVSGDAHVAGRVEGDVVLISGDAMIAGRVDGNLVTIAGRARLLPKASVGGDLIYGDERPRIAPTARVGGEIEEEDWTDSIGLFQVIGALVLWLAVTVSSLVLGLLLLAIAPRAADAVFAQAQSRFWTAVGIGAAIFILLPLAIFVAAITLIGLPLAIGLGLALLPLTAVAYVTAAWALGRAIVKPPRGRILAFLAGLAILRAVALIPILGLLAWLGATIVGLGLLGAAIAAAREPARAPGS